MYPYLALSNDVLDPPITHSTFDVHFVLLLSTIEQLATFKRVFRDIRTTVEVPDIQCGGQKCLPFWKQSDRRRTAGTERSARIVSTLNS